MADGWMPDKLEVAKLTHSHLDGRKQQQVTRLLPSARTCCAWPQHTPVNTSLVTKWVGQSALDSNQLQHFHSDRLEQPEQLQTKLQ
jgi:hypothetical protein